MAYGLFFVLAFGNNGLEWTRMDSRSSLCDERCCFATARVPSFIACFFCEPVGSPRRAPG